MKLRSNVAQLNLMKVADESDNDIVLGLKVG